MKWWRVSFGIVLSAAIVGGLVWAADLNGSAKASAPSSTVDVEAIIAQKTGLSIQSVRRVESAALSVAADKAAAAGLITADEASNLRQLSVGPILNAVLDGAAQSAHVSDSDLVDGITQGKSLAQVAAAQGVSRDALKVNLLATLQTQLGSLQTAGVLDASQAAMATTTLTAYLDKVIDATLPMHEAK